MKLCLSCYHLWPVEALLCGQCGRSFGGRLCARRHHSPPSSRVCVHCGLTELTAPTAYVPLGWVIPVLLGCGFLLAMSAGWHLAQPAAFAWLKSAFVYVCLGAVIIFLLPGRLGRDVRRLVTRFLRGAWRLLLFGAGYRMLRATLHSLKELLGGRRR